MFGCSCHRHNHTRVRGSVPPDGQNEYRQGKGDHEENGDKVPNSHSHRNGSFWLVVSIVSIDEMGVDHTAGRCVARRRGRSR